GECVRRLEVHADQIADRIVILRAVQPPQHHARGALRDLRLGELLLQPFGYAAGCLGRRLLLLILGRHLVPVDHIHHLRPSRADQRIGEGVGQGVEPEISLLLVRAMARDAVLAEEWLRRLDEVRTNRVRETEDEQEGDAWGDLHSEKDSYWG